MSEKNTYQPIINVENDYKLAPTSRGNEHAIHELIVRWKGHPIEERQFICENEGWTPEKRIPELSKDVRMKVSAIRAMMKRLEGKPEELEKEMAELVDQFSDEHIIEPLTADQYWLGLAKILFVNFPEDTDPKQLDFKVIKRAYEDFF